jgi:fido (protein-threonine AMPylation protein)
MARKPFRVEVNYPAGKKPQYFLTRDVHLGDRRGKVRKYLGTNPPTATEVERYRKSYAPEIEVRVALKRADFSAESYSPHYLTDGLLREVERVKSINNSVLSLLTVSEVEAYEREFEISYIHGTTAIEGNTLTLVQAQELLTRGRTPAGKELREINEVQNFKRVVRYRNAYKHRVTLDFIRHLHALVLENIDTESAGSFRRRDDIGIEGCPLPVTPSARIGSELQKAVDRYYKALDRGEHPVEQAVLFHYNFEMIHPFTDGNGRVGREILNFMLTRSRYPRLLFLGKDRDRYLDALRDGNDGNNRRMVCSFTELIISQRLGILETRLREVAVRPKKVGQLRLSDFVTS